MAHFGPGALLEPLVYEKFAEDEKNNKSEDAKFNVSEHTRGIKVIKPGEKRVTHHTHKNEPDNHADRVPGDKAAERNARPSGGDGNQRPRGVFRDEHGFYEMNIPVLESIPGGADAKPFITHMDAIDQDFYLRISQELFLKRLIGCGYEKVYEIGPRFRNEGYSDEHLPEHIAMEFYWAYANWEEGMEFIKALYNRILDEVYDGNKKFSIRGHEVDFSKDWEIVDFAKIFKDKFDIDVHNTNIEEIEKVLREKHIHVDADSNIHRGIDSLWKELRKEISGPAFLINHPKYLSPLSKSKALEPHITERFQPIIAGSELGNGWSEINDPQDQYARFKEQQDLRESGDEEAQWLDIDYVEMLEYGMPPTFGYGHSERTFWFLEDVPGREGVPFPQMRYEIDDTTKEIYGL